MSKLLGQRLNDNLRAYAGYIDRMHTLLSNIKISQGTKPISDLKSMKGEIMPYSRFNMELTQQIILDFDPK